MSNSYVLSVMDTPMGRAVDPRATAGTVFSTTQAITKPFTKGDAVVFKLPQAIIREGTAPTGITVEDLVRTNDNSVAFDSLQFDKDAAKGPFSLAVAVKGKYPGAADGKEFNLVLVGDRDFLSDALFYRNLNRDLVMNSISSLSKVDNLISIAPKDVTRTPMELTDTQFRMFVFAFLLPLPLVFYVMSGMLWYRRRYS